MALRCGAGRYGPGAAALLVASLLAGCTTDRFAPLAGQFGTLTREAAGQQDARLAVVLAEERARYRATLAQRGADLRIADCAPAIAGGPAPRTCRVVERVAGGTLAELPPTLRLDNLAALNGALLSYADGLIMLTGDPAEDEGAFADAAAQLAGAIGELDGALRNAAAPPEGVEEAGTLLGRLGNAYFAARRAAVLKRMIVTADPLVARATALLGGADGALDLYDRVALYGAIQRAEEAAAAARIAGDPAVLEQAQAALFDAVAAYNAAPGEQARYAAMGAAHADLARAAQAGAGPTELAAAAEGVIGLAQAIGATRGAFAGEDR